MRKTLDFRVQRGAEERQISGTVHHSSTLDGDPLLSEWAVWIDRFWSPKGDVNDDGLASHCFPRIPVFDLNAPISRYFRICQLQIEHYESIE